MAETDKWDFQSPKYKFIFKIKQNEKPICINLTLQNVHIK